VTDAVKKTGSSLSSSAAMAALIASHVLFVLSGAAYSVYWVLEEETPGAAAVSAFTMSVVLGFVGAAGEVVASGAPRPRNSPYRRVGPGPIVGACLAVLLVAFFVTTIVMGRPFTSELIFVTAWAALELSSLDDAHERGWITGRRAVAAAAAVTFVFAFGLACYAVYYLLDGRARFYAGLVPYGVFSLAMLVVAGLLALEKRRSGGPPKSPS